MTEKTRDNDKSVFMLYSSVMISRIEPDFWTPERQINPALLQMLLVACLHASAAEAMEKHDAEYRNTVLVWDLTKRHSSLLDNELSRVASAMVYGPETNVQYPWKIFVRVLPLFQKRNSFPMAKASHNPQEVHLEQIKWVRHEAKAFLKEFGGASPIHLALIEAIFDEPKMAGFLRSSIPKSYLLQPVTYVEDQDKLLGQSRQSENMGRQSENMGRQSDNMGRQSENIGRQPENIGRQSDNIGRQSDNMGRQSENIGTSSREDPYSPFQRQSFRTRSEYSQQQPPMELRSSAPVYHTAPKLQTLQSQRGISGGEQSEYGVS